MIICPHAHQTSHTLVQRLDGGKQPDTCFECLDCWCVRFYSSHRWVSREIATALIRESGGSIPEWRGRELPKSPGSEGGSPVEPPLLNKTGGSDVCPICGGPLVDYEDDPPRRPPRRWCPSLKCPANLEAPR